MLTAANLMQALIDAGDAAQALRLTTDAMRQAPHIQPLAKHAWALVALAHWDDAQAAVAHALGVARAAGAEPPAPALEALVEELRGGWWRPLALGGITLRLPAKPTGPSWQPVPATPRSSRATAASSRPSQPQSASSSTWPGGARGRPGASTGSSAAARSRWAWPACRTWTSATGAASCWSGCWTPMRARLPGLKASLAAMDCAFASFFGLRKLVSHVYGDNPAAQANTLHLGLRQEGLLRAHLLTGDGPLDLYVNGLLADEFRADARLPRLLARQLSA